MIYHCLIMYNQPSSLPIRPRKILYLIYNLLRCCEVWLVDYISLSIYRPNHLSLKDTDSPSSLIINNVFSAWEKKIKIGIIVAEWGDSIGSVPQGSCFGPLLYVIHINDLHRQGKYVNYMDDITLTEYLSSVIRTVKCNTPRLHPNLVYGK